MVAYGQGEVLLAWLVFSDGEGSKRRPVLVVHDFGDNDLLVVPITSHPVRGSTDVFLSQWKNAGLKLPCNVRTEKLATIAKSCVERKLGALLPDDFARFRKTLELVVQQILAPKN